MSLIYLCLNYALYFVFCLDCNVEINMWTKLNLVLLFAVTSHFLSVTSDLVRVYRNMNTFCKAAVK